MADADNVPLTDEEREELHALRAEKAAREEEARIRAEREELRALRAEQERVDAEILRERAERQEPCPQRATSHDTDGKAAEKDSGRKTDVSSGERMTFGQRMVTRPEAKGEDDIPGMAPAQKIVIAVCLVLAAVAIGYIVLFNLGGIA